MRPLNLLLVEDEPHKKQRLLDCIAAHPELFAEPDLAFTTAKALELLSSKRYDILLADLNLPRRINGEPTEENGLELLLSVRELATDVGATFSISITRAEKVSDAVQAFFVGHPWGLLRYRDDSTQCLADLTSIALYIQQEIHGQQQREPTVDVLIITALFEPELRAVEALIPSLSALRPLDVRQAVKTGELDLGNGRSATIAVAHAERMGPVHAAVSTTKLCQALKPSVVVMAGICAGYPGKATLGDVVAAETTWLWQDGKFAVVDGVPVFQESPDQIHVSPQVRNCLLSLRGEAEFWNGFATKARSHGLVTPRMVIGPLATGAAVLADANVRDAIARQQHRAVVGLDMETYAVYAAAQACPAVKHMVSLKAVCDGGDKSKGDEHQAYAADVSAACAVRFVQRFLAATSR